MLRSAVVGSRILMALCFLGLGGTAAAQERRNDEPSYQELLKILETAPPAPVTAPRSPRLQSAPRDRGRVVEFDPQTRRGRIMPAAPRPQFGNRRIRGSEGAAITRRVDGDSATVEPRARRSGSTLSPQATTPTRPISRTDGLDFPLRTVFKLIVRFQVNGTNYDYGCSASAIGEFLLLTAAHCIHNLDPNGDGNMADARNASSVWAFAAQTDRVEPLGVADHPYGVAKATLFRIEQEWIETGSFDYDFALITLDRRMGDHTGSMGAETAVETTALNFTGYPADSNVPAGNLLQYPGFDANNVDTYSTNTVELDAFIYQGHSGGPAWRAADGIRNIQGVISNTDFAGNAGLARMTTNRINTINLAISEDEAARPPISLPNLIEYVFETDAKGLLTDTVDQGGQISVKWNAFNAGFANTGPVTFDFYLSKDKTITPTDSLLFSGTLQNGTIPPLNSFTGTHSMTVPRSQAPGRYYVGWIMQNSTDSEIDDNTVVITSKRLEVREGLQPPPRVVLNGPGGRVATPRPVFRWRRAARATHYEITGKAGDNLILSAIKTAAAFRCGDAQTTCQIKYPGSLSPGRYSWAVRAINSAGPGPRSAFKAFQIVPRQTRNNLALQE